MNNNIAVAKNLKTVIENMDPIHHEKVLIIMNNHNVHISENRNGCFINITNMSDELINELNTFINYINKQEKNLLDIENIKDEFKKNFYNKKKDVKEKSELLLND